MQIHVVEFVVKEEHQRGDGTMAFYAGHVFFLFRNEFRAVYLSIRRELFVKYFLVCSYKEARKRRYPNLHPMMFHPLDLMCNTPSL